MRNHECMPGSLPTTRMADAVALYGQRLMRAALLLCRDGAEAEDLVQDTFSRAIVHEHSFRGESSIYTWLYVIMRRLYFKRRRLFRWKPMNAPTAVEDHVVDPPEVAYDRNYRKEMLDASLSSLKPRQREILLLRYVEGMKIAEISMMLGLSPGTVKSRLHHAVRALRGRLDELGSGTQMKKKE